MPGSEVAKEMTVEDGLFLEGSEGFVDPADAKEGLEKSGRPPH